MLPEKEKTFEFLYSAYNDNGMRFGNRNENGNECTRFRYFNSKT